MKKTLKIVAESILVFNMIGAILLSVMFIAAEAIEKDMPLFIVLEGIIILHFVGCGFALGGLVRDVKKTLKHIGIIVGIIVASAVDLMVTNLFYLAFSVLFDVEGSLRNLNTGITVILAGIIIWGLCKKQKKIVIISSMLLVIYGLLVIGALYGAPYFIRGICVEYFVETWLKYSAIIVILTALVIKMVITMQSKRMLKEAKGKSYSDDDLMLLRGFDRYKLTRYYLLKGRLHNVITYVMPETQGDSDEDVFLDVNRKMSVFELWQYCIVNPGVGDIVLHIKRRGTASSISNIINSINPQLTFQSEGGQFAENCISKMRKSTKIIFGLGVGASYYLCIAKFIMNQYEGKENTSLIFFIVVGVMMTVCLYFISDFLWKQIIDFKFTKKIVKHIRELQEDIDVNHDNMSEEEINAILRAYVLRDDKSRDHKKEGH